MLALYFAPGASSMAVHIALHEAGAAFEARPVSLARQEQRSAAFLG
jgi:glutathione S-transferase